jgi:adenine phosphoribosyltransferase
VLDDSAALQVRIVERLRFVNGHADNWRLFDDAELFVAVVDALIEPFRGRAITKVAGIEARGFILGGACALRLGAGFAAIRKSAGLFPGPKLTVAAAPDYRGNSHDQSAPGIAESIGDYHWLVRATDLHP